MTGKTRVYDSTDPHQHGPKERIYHAEIEPLVLQIKELSRKHSIPVLMNFELDPMPGAAETQTLQCPSVDALASVPRKLGDPWPVRSTVLEFAIRLLVDTTEFGESLREAAHVMMQAQRDHHMAHMTGGGCAECSSEGGDAAY